MKNIFAWLLVLMMAVALPGCGGGDEVDEAAAEDLVGEDDNVPPSDPTTPGVLGDLTDLGDLLQPQGDHWYFTRATAINDSGIIVGQSNRGNPVKAAFSWNPATSSMTYLGIHNGYYDENYGLIPDTTPQKPFIYSNAVDINSAGVIIGNSSTGLDWPRDAEKRAFAWKAGTFIDLANPPQTIDTEIYLNAFSEAVDINEQGEIVLTAELKDTKQAYYWNGVAVYPQEITPGISFDYPLLVPLGGIVGEPSEAVALNENRQAIVNSGSTAIFHDLNWGVVESLNYLPIPGAKTEAVDINDSRYANHDGIPDGHVIGNSGIESSGDGQLGIEDKNVRGFFWDGGAMYPVTDLGGGSSVTTDLNNQDQVVGAATLAGGNFHAILWTLGADKKGVILDLGTLGGNNSYATAINEAGQVTGWAETGQLYEEQGIQAPIRHAFLWSNGRMYDLGAHNDFYIYPFVPAYPFSEAVAINASGQLAGNSLNLNNLSRGFYLAPVFP